tara:strand:+ start:39061 stop:39621 length:561 start_codon:yes stop_codon:yes gene_type:complete
METSTPFSDQTLESMVTASIESVFLKMIPLPLVFKRVGTSSYQSQLDKESADPKILPIDKSMIVGSIGFMGEVDGMFYLYMDEGLGRKIASSFLGLTEEEVKEEGPESIGDAIGEFSNMIVGTFKNGLCDSGYNCRLTIPSVLRGNHLTINPSTSFPAVRKTFYFDVAGDPYVVDLFMRALEPFQE